jgi:lambda family phage tail tape measure protein
LTDIASLGFRIDTAAVEKGEAKLDDLVDAAQRAEDAEASLAQASRAASNDVAKLGEAAAEAAQGVSAMEATTAALAESEEAAKNRIREMVRASLEKQQAMLATASATRQASQATRELSQSQGASRQDTLGASFAETQQELQALSEAMTNQAQSLDDIGERRAWVTDLYERGLISLADSESHLKTLDRQEKEVTRSIESHAREVEHLLRTYDPASAAIAKITEDEKRLADALRSGAISAQQHAKAMAGLDVNRAKWQAEAESVKETARQINYLALSSTAAFRDYATLIGAVGRGDFGLASNQVLQLSSRAGALRALLTPLAAGIGAVATAAGAMAVAFHKGQQESFELQKNLILSGNAAGVAAGHLAIMAERLDEIGGTRGAASSTLGQLAATGRVAADDLERFSVVAQQLARNAGQPVADTVKIFAELGRAPVEASRRLNEQMNHLTEEIDDQIVALQARGDIEAAGALAQRTYADAALDRARRLGEQMPLLTKAAKETGSAFKEMWDFITGIGVGDTPEQRLRELRERRGDRPLFGGRAQFDQGAFNRDQQEEALAKAIEARDRRLAESAAKAREFRDRREAQASLSQRLQLEKQIGDAVSMARAAAVQRELNDTVSQYAAYESQLEALREAGSVSEEIYYSEKRKLIEQNRDAQIEAIKLENARLAAENNRTRASAQQLSQKADPVEKARIEASAQAQIIANQSKIADGESKIAILRGQAIAQINAMDTQQKAAAEALVRSYQDARAAAQAYLDVLSQQRERELAAFGRGSRERQRGETRNRIEDRFAEQRLQLESDRRTGPQTEEAQRRYEQDLALLEEFRGRALKVDEAYWRRRTELEGDWSVGAREAMWNYLDNARNVAAQTEQLFTNAFQSMEDALVQFTMTGKLDFKSLADAIIADLLRIQLRAAIAGILGNAGWLSGLTGLFGGPAGGTGAGGGTVPTSGGALFADTGIRRVPRDNQVAILHKDEAVIPARMNPFAGGRGLGGTSMSFQTTINADSGTNVAQLQALLDQRDEQLKGEIAENLGRRRWDNVLS